MKLKKLIFQKLLSSYFFYKIQRFQKQNQKQKKTRYINQWRKSTKKSIIYSEKIDQTIKRKVFLKWKYNIKGNLLHHLLMKFIYYQVCSLHICFVINKLFPEQTLISTSTLKSIEKLNTATVFGYAKHTWNKQLLVLINVLGLVIKRWIDKESEIDNVSIVYKLRYLFQKKKIVLSDVYKLYHDLSVKDWKIQKHPEEAVCLLLLNIWVIFKDKNVIIDKFLRIAPWANDTCFRAQLRTLQQGLYLKHESQVFNMFLDKWKGQNSLIGENSLIPIHDTYIKSIFINNMCFDD